MRLESQFRQSQRLSIASALVLRVLPSKLNYFYLVVGVIHQPPMMICPLIAAGA